MNQKVVQPGCGHKVKRERLIYRQTGDRRRPAAKGSPGRTRVSARMLCQRRWGNTAALEIAVTRALRPCRTTVLGQTSMPMWVDRYDLRNTGRLKSERLLPARCRVAARDGFARTRHDWPAKQTACRAKVVATPRVAWLTSVKRSLRPPRTDWTASGGSLPCCEVRLECHQAPGTAGKRMQACPASRHDTTSIPPARQDMAMT